MGDVNGGATGGFVLFDEEFNVKGRWESHATPFGYGMPCSLSLARTLLYLS